MNTTVIVLDSISIFQTVELFSRQSIFIMSIAIYCSIGTLDRETIFEIHSGVCLYLLLHGQWAWACCIFLSLSLSSVPLRTQFFTSMSKITNKMNYDENLSIDRIFSIIRIQSQRLGRSLYTIDMYGEIKLMPTNKKTTMPIDISLHTNKNRKIP